MLNKSKSDVIKCPHCQKPLPELQEQIEVLERLVSLYKQRDELDEQHRKYSGKPSLPDVSFAATENGRHFHRLDCEWLEYGSNLIYFDSHGEAVALD